MLLTSTKNGKKDDRLEGVRWTGEGLVNWNYHSPVEPSRNGQAVDDEVEPHDYGRGVALDGDVEPVKPIGFGQLAADHPRLKPIVIDGLARRGEVVNVIAAPKRGKSWLVYHIILSIVSNRWLFGKFPVEQGRTLLIDNELHSPTIAHRVPIVADALGIRPEEYRENIDVLALRGRLTDFHGLRRIIAEIERGTYQMIVFDAYYRMIPVGVSKNDNSAVAGIYNILDQYAAMTDAALLLVHHSSKGSQTDKAITDVGAGAGSQSRAADSHLILREHEQENCIVLESAVRSFKPVEPLVLEWNFPLWTPRDNLDPSELKGRKTKGEERQDDRDHRGMTQIVDGLRVWDHETDGISTVNQVASKVAMGREKTRRLIDKLCVSGDVTRSPVSVKGNETNAFTLSTDSSF